MQKHTSILLTCNGLEIVLVHLDPYAFFDLYFFLGEDEAVEFVFVEPKQLVVARVVRQASLFRLVQGRVKERALGGLEEVGDFLGHRRVHRLLHGRRFARGHRESFVRRDIAVWVRFGRRVRWWWGLRLLWRVDQRALGFKQ